MGNMEINNKKTKITLLSVVLFIGLMALLAMATNPPSEGTFSTPIVTPQSEIHPTSRSSATPSPSNAWSYTRHESEMGLGPVNTASIQSANTVNFGFPYQGPQHATLTLRTHPQYGKNVFFSIERGQLLIRSYENDTVTLRFDGNKPMRVRALEPKDNDSTTIFLEGYNSLVAQMKKAKILRIQVPVYQEGERVFEFDVQGLNWPMKK